MPGYAIYARKSSESEDRQILSIDAQLDELTTFAERTNLPIADRFSESKSAKAPGRPVFKELMDQVAAEKFDGILTWRPDRLSRNPTDCADLIWALEKGHITEIVTPSTTYRNEPDHKFFFQLEVTVAKKYVDDLSVNVQRGNKAKLKQGWLPGPAPLGYLNDRINKTIVKDPDRFHLVRQMWDLILAGRPVPEVLKTATNDWGLRTPVKKRSGGTRLSKSSFYYLLANSFYYGLIMRKGLTYSGSHESMITQEEFETVQRMIGRDTRPPRRSQTFSFTGLLTCGTCGFAVTAERHTKASREYEYYRCSKKNRRVHCQEPYVRTGVLEEQLRDLLQSLVVPKQVLTWFSPYLEKLAKSDLENSEHRRQSLIRTLSVCQTKLHRLLDLKLRSQISDEEFISKRKDLITEQINLKQKLALLKESPNRWLEITKNVLSFGKHAVNRFNVAPGEERRSLLLTVGSNYVLKNKMVLTQLKKPFDLLALRGPSPDWWGILDQVRNFFHEHPDTIQLSKFCQKQQK